MSESAYEDLARDLIVRTETAVEKVAALAVDTGITFQVADIVRAVEDDLPPDYPAPADGANGRRQMISRMAESIMTGEMYEN